MSDTHQDHTWQQDPAFGGTGKPNAKQDRDFSGVFDDLEFDEETGKETFLIE